MSDRDPHPDSLPQDNHDRHSDVEQATTSANRDITNVEEPDGGVTSRSVDDDAGAAGGSGGVTSSEQDPA